MLLCGCGNNPYPPGETAGSVLYQSIADDPKTLDPSVAYDVETASVTDVIYPSYYRYHFLKRDPFVLELNLGAAEAVRESYPVTIHVKGQPVRKAGERWTFRIRRGLRFQDDPCFPGGKGREITARDFLYSLRRMADPTVACPVKNYFEDKILGFDRYESLNRPRIAAKQPFDDTAPVEGLQEDPRDPYTFRIVLTQPYPQLRYLMAMHFTTPLAREAVLKYGKELARHPVGCGPFMLSRYLPRREITLTANPNRPRELYPSDGMPDDRAAGRLADAGRPLPLTDKIEITTIREGITGWNLFLQGYQDAWGVTQTNFQQVMSRQGQLSPEMVRKGVKLYRDVSPNVSYFSFNMDDPLVGGYTLQKRKLRQAISTAFDARSFIDLFAQGIGQPAEYVIPPGIYGYETAYRNPFRRYNVERAKHLLAEAGYPGGVDPKTGDRLTIRFDNTATTAAGRQLVGWVQKQFDAIGVHMVSQSWRGPVWQGKVDKGQFQFIHYGWIADYPDPENFALLFYSKNARPGPNVANYKNPEFDRLFEQSRAMDDGPARLALLGKMRGILVEDCPWIFLSHDESLKLAYDWLHNVKPHPVAVDTVKYLRVDGDRRARQQAAWNHPNPWPAVAFAAFLIAGSLPAVETVRRRRGRRVRRSPGPGREA